MQAYDRVTPKTEKPLRPTRAAFHNVTVSDDPVIKCAPPSPPPPPRCRGMCLGGPCRHCRADAGSPARWRVPTLCPHHASRGRVAGT